MRGPCTLILLLGLLGAADKNSPQPPSHQEAQAKIRKALNQHRNTEVPLDLLIGQPARVPLPVLPLRVGLDRKKLLGYSMDKGKVLRLDGKAPGNARLTMLFGDAQKPKEQFVVTLAVRVRKSSP